jgi:hypothetical protein
MREDATEAGVPLDVRGEVLAHWARPGAHPELRDATSSMRVRANRDVNRRDAGVGRDGSVVEGLLGVGTG